MSTYTNDENIRFLHDKNISQTLGDDTARQTNTVPSLDLLNKVNNALTAYDSNLCAYLDNLNKLYEYDTMSPYLSVITKIEQVKGQLTGIESIELLSSHVKNLKEFVEDTIDSLDVATLSETNKFIRTLTEIDGKIQATFTNVLSSDLTGQLQQTQIENLTADIESCYKKKGGLINGNAQVNGQLSVAGESIVNDNSTVRGNFVQGRGTSYTGDAEHSVVLGISASTNKDDVFLWNGKQNEAYTDHGRGTFNINAVSGVNGVFVGNQTLEKIVDDKREAARLQAKEYTDGVSVTLSNDYVGKIAAAKTQAYNEALSDANGYTNGVSVTLSNDYVGKITVAKTQTYNEALSDANDYTDGVSASLSTDYVNKIAIAKSEAITAAATDATGKVNALDNTLLNVGMLVSADLDFDYDETTRLITLNIQDYGGNDHTFTIDSARFIKGRIVDHVNIVEIGSQQVLRIWWTVEEGGTGIYSDVPLTTLAQVYHQGEGIAITLGEDGYVISVNDTIVNKSFLNGKIAEINTDIADVNDKANTNTAKITSLANISADHDERISTLETGLATASSNIATNASNITNADNHISNLETYATTLSAPDGQIQTLSGAINTLSEYAHNHISGRIELDEGKIDAISAHAERLQAYATALSGGNGQIDTLSDSIDANTANLAIANGDITSLKNYANVLSGGNGHISKLSNSIDNNTRDITQLNNDINTLTAHIDSLQTYANLLSNDGGTINTLSSDINQLSTNIINSDAFIGEIKVNYNNLTAGTDQAWVSHYGNNLSDVIKHFSLAPLGYVKNNTIIKVTYTNVPKDADRIKFAILKYTTDDGITFTDNDYIIIHGDFDQIKLEDIQLINVHYVNAVKRCELFELSNAVVKLSTDLSGEIDALSTALSGEIDKLSADLSGEIDALSTALSVEIDKLSTALSGEIDALSTALSGDIDKLSDDLSGDLSAEIITRSSNDVVLSTAIDNKIWIYDKTTDDSIPVSTSLSVVKINKDDFEDEIIKNVTLNNNTLYIVESDYIDAYGEEIKNVAQSDIDTNAATVGQVNAKAVEISNELSTNWLRCAPDNISINEAGSYANILQSTGNVGGFRVVLSSDGHYNADFSNGSTVYQLNNIRKYTNLTEFDDYALDDNSINGIVRKHSASKMLSAEMLKIQYPIGSVYYQIIYPTEPTIVPDPPTECPVSAAGTSWKGPIIDGTITVDDTTTLTKYCWIRLS